MNDLAAWLDAAIGRVEQAARDAEAFGAGFIGEPDVVYGTGAGGPYMRVVVPGFQGQTEAATKHFAIHAPVDVLRRCAADRALIADLTAERHVVVDDCWYTCAAATEEHDGGETCDDKRLGKPCDCGRDNRVGRRLGRIAEGYGYGA